MGRRAGLFVEVMRVGGNQPVFADHDAGLLFAGDHVLSTITPSIGFEPDPSPLPLGDYLDSLRLVARLPEMTLLPGHGPVREGFHDRVTELLDHHDVRLGLARTAVTDGAGTTVLDVAGLAAPSVVEACLRTRRRTLRLGEQDWVFPTYRDSVALVSRGVDPVEVLTLLRGDQHCGYDVAQTHVAAQCTPFSKASR